MEQRPDVTIVRTVDDETDAGMPAVNDAVGFEVVAACTQVVVKV